MGSTKYHHCSVSIGLWLFTIGGVLDGTYASNVVEAFDTSLLSRDDSSSWVKKASMIDKRSSHGCHVGVYKDEEGIYVAGGRDDSGNDLASAEFYNPATDTWKALGPLNTARVYSPMTMLGQKLIVSGGSPHYLTSVEAWDGTGWDEVDNLKVGRVSLFS